MNPMYFDKEGKPLELMEWAELSESGDEYRVIGKTVVGEYLISTIWIGLNMNLGHGVGLPLIFETMVFSDSGNTGWDDYQLRYATEEQAKAGHEETIKKVQASP